MEDLEEECFKNIIIEEHAGTELYPRKDLKKSEASFQVIFLYPVYNFLIINMTFNYIYSFLDNYHAKKTNDNKSILPNSCRLLKEHDYPSFRCRCMVMMMRMMMLIVLLHFSFV